MTDRLRTISLRQFRERAAEIREPIDIAVRDRDGNFQIIGYFTPYATYPADAVELPPPTGELPSAHITVHTREGAVLDFGEGEVAETTGPKVIRTPEEAASAVQSVRPFPKSVQAGRKRGKA